jgi:hypothetical protein
MNPELATLKILLALHDWYYDYSDDYSAWTRGQNESRAIQAEVKRLKDLGHADEVNALVVKYAPKV